MYAMSNFIEFSPNKSMEYYIEVIHLQTVKSFIIIIIIIIIITIFLTAIGL